MKTGGLSLDQAPAEDISLRFFISAPIFGILAGLMAVSYTHLTLPTRS